MRNWNYTLVWKWWIIPRAGREWLGIFSWSKEWWSIDKTIGHFWVHLSFHFKARLSAKSLLWKSVFIHIEIGTNYHNKNSHLDSLWKRDWGELGNGLLLNSVIAKYGDLSVSRRSIICLSFRLWQITDLLTTDKFWYFCSTSLNNC